MDIIMPILQKQRKPGEKSQEFDGDASPYALELRIFHLEQPLTS